MQPMVSAGESSAVTITGKVRRRTLWRFVDSYGAADGIGPYSRVCSLFALVFSGTRLCSSCFVRCCLQFVHNQMWKLYPWGWECWMARELVFVVCSSSAATARASASSKKRVRARSARVSLAKARRWGRSWRCDRPALDAVGIREHRLPPSLSDECNASCRSMPPLPGWLVHPRWRRQGVHTMPIGEWLLPGKECRHPQARPLASAAVQVRIKRAAHCV
jgi:hypothetical protein